MDPTQDRRRSPYFGLAVLAPLLLAALITGPAASAHDFTGFTSFGDGTNVITVVRNATITARVAGGATVGSAYYLTIGPEVGVDDECHEGRGIRLNPNPVYPNPDGSINPMSAVIDVEPGKWRVSFCGEYQVARGRVTVVQPAVVSGATFYSDGSSAKSGPSGAMISLFATRAEPGFGYTLVSGQQGGGQACGVYITPINEAVRYANDQGVIGQTAGTINRPVGVWQVCFLATGQTVTGPVTYTVV